MAKHVFSSITICGWMPRPWSSHSGGSLSLQKWKFQNWSTAEGHLDVPPLHFFDLSPIDRPAGIRTQATHCSLGLSVQERLEPRKKHSTCLFTFPKEKGGLQVKLPLGTLFTSVWGNLERCSQFDDGSRKLLAICYREALQENGCLDLLGLQDTSQHPSWKKCWKIYLREWEMSIRLSERLLDTKVLESENLDFSSILCAWHPERERNKVLLPRFKRSW